jgi:hypothetical protein
MICGPGKYVLFVHHLSTTIYLLWKKFQTINMEHKTENQKRWYEKNKKVHYLNTRERSKRIYTENALFIKTLKEFTPCSDCGIKYPAYVMDFDHLRDKSGQVHKFLSYSHKRLLEEISKCEIVCANCHRERTYQRMGL